MHPVKCNYFHGPHAAIWWPYHSWVSGVVYVHNEGWPRGEEGGKAVWRKNTMKNFKLKGSQELSCSYRQMKALEGRTTQSSECVQNWHLKKGKFEDAGGSLWGQDGASYTVYIDGLITQYCQWTMYSVVKLRALRRLLKHLYNNPLELIFSSFYSVKIKV